MKNSKIDSVYLCKSTDNLLELKSTSSFELSYYPCKWVVIILSSKETQFHLVRTYYNQFTVESRNEKV